MPRRPVRHRRCHCLCRPEPDCALFRERRCVPGICSHNPLGFVDFPLTFPCHFFCGAWKARGGWDGCHRRTVTAAPGDLCAGSGWGHHGFYRFVWEKQPSLKGGRPPRREKNRRAAEGLFGLALDPAKAHAFRPPMRGLSRFAQALLPTAPARPAPGRFRRPAPAGMRR